MIVTPMFAGLFGLFYVLLALNVIRLRIGSRVAYGDGGNSELLKAIRTHANFAEYVPFALVLFWCLETMAFATSFVFWMGVMLLIGRVLHVIGMANPRSLMLCRQIGMVLTLTVIIAASVRLLMHYFPVSV